MCHPTLWSINFAPHAIINVPSEPVVISAWSLWVRDVQHKQKLKVEKWVVVKRTWGFSRYGAPTVINVNLTVWNRCEVCDIIAKFLWRDIVMGNCLSAGPNRPSVKDWMAHLTRRGNAGGGVNTSNLVWVTRLPWEPMGIPNTQAHLHSVHHIRNPNSLPPVPDNG